MDAEVAHWAASRGPDLLARAEEEALAELKRALIDAALAHRGRRTTPSARGAVASRAESAERVTPQTGDGIWVYCVGAQGTELPTGNPGVHPDGPLERIDQGGLAALVSRAPLAEFGEEALRHNLNDLGWLEHVARAHEASLEAALATSTIVPLRLCTIYGDEVGVRRMLEEERESFEAALELLAGRQEWGLKLLVDREALDSAARAESTEATTLERERDASSGGGAYLLGRRLERQVREVADRLLGELAEDVHACLQDWADDAVLNAPQNRDLSHHEGEMVLNGAYLVETEKVGRFRQLVDELQERHRDVGARLELTGPWPPYNFVPRVTSAREAAPG